MRAINCVNFIDTAYLVFVLAAALCLLPTASGATPDYERDIQPILHEKCFSCHSRLKQKSDLRLDAGALIHRGGKHGAAIVPGKSGESPLIQRVLSRDDDERMPPDAKPLSTNQITLLRAWIDSGASYPKDEIIPSTPAEHWAFQPLHAPALPAVKNKQWAHNPIDLFVLSKLEQRNWKPAPAATDSALLRRIYLDLSGTPPSPDEQLAFARPGQSLDRVIGDLLDRPTYGERWARHWMDVVRYADSNGYERDAEKPFVWRYRDYVINALNSDKPFDRFVLEQLAGDELQDFSAETMIATTFLRLGHWDDEPADPATDRYDQLDDMVSTTAQTFLGLTLGCARCHDHKFEPLSTRDYYSMVAIFNPLRRPQNGRAELTVPVGSMRQLTTLAKRDREIESLSQQTNIFLKREIEERARQLRAAIPDLPAAYILQEAAQPCPPTHILQRGSPTRPGELVSPSVPTVLVKEQPSFPSPDDRSSRRRLGLAQWLASPNNPLTARVMVNRVWKEHFGEGLVRTPNDFGLMGEPPTHPELLNWLANWFVHDAHWSLKKLHALILASSAWRMSSESNPEYAAVDPEDRLLWRRPYHRLEVEAIRDSILAVSGQLNPKMSGPAMKPRIPQAALEANTDKDSIWKPSDDLEASRRTVYTFIKRGLVVPMLEVFDLGDTVQSCPKRLVTTVAPQALTLFNGEFVNQQCRFLAARLLREAGPDLKNQIDLAWRLALCRPPTEAEVTTMLHFQKLAGPERPALEQMCRVLFNLNEFVYAD